MKFIRNILDKIEPNFHQGGKFPALKGCDDGGRGMAGRRHSEQPIALRSFSARFVMTEGTFVKRRSSSKKALHAC